MLLEKKRFDKGRATDRSSRSRMRYVILIVTMTNAREVLGMKVGKMRSMKLWSGCSLLTLLAWPGAGLVCQALGRKEASMGHAMRRRFRMPPPPLQGARGCEDPSTFH